MEFGKSATNFDSPHAESCPNGRRNAEPPKLPALFPNSMHCCLNWPEKGVVTVMAAPGGGGERIVMETKVKLAGTMNDLAPLPRIGDKNASYISKGETKLQVRL